MTRQDKLRARMAEEAAFHVAMQAEQFRRDGLGPTEADRLARVAFGARERFAEEAAEAGGIPLLDEIAQDIRHAVRSLARARGFAITSIATLALGLSAITVMYSLVDHILLRPLSYPAADRLAVIRTRIEELADTYESTPASLSLYAAWRERCRSCELIAAIKPENVMIQGAVEPERLGALRVTSSTFPLLGLRLERGRAFGPAEEIPGHAATAVLSGDYARQRFGSAAGALEQAILIDGRLHTVVGVIATPTHLPLGNQLGDLVPLPRKTDVLLPMAIGSDEINAPGGFDYAVLVRSRATDLTALRRELNAIMADLPTARRGGLTITASVIALADQVVGPERRALWLELGAVATLLLLICVNLGCLFVARSEERAREHAIRHALGAGRARLTRLAVIEALMLTCLGALLGLLVARQALGPLLRLAPQNVPRLTEVSMDWRVAGVVLCLAAVVGVLSAVIPARLAIGGDPADALRSGGRGITHGRRAHAFRRGLLCAQGALCAGLLLITGLFVMSYARVLRVSHGFDADGLTIVDIAAPPGYRTPEGRAQLFASIAERLSRTGVTSVGVASRLPLDGESDVNAISLVNDARAQSARPVANIRYVSGQYFATMHMAMMRGASFDAAAPDARVVVVSARAALALFGSTDVVGRELVVGDDQAASRIVGVTTDARTNRPEDAEVPMVYVPLARGIRDVASVVIRADSVTSATVAQWRRQLREVDGEIPILRIRRGTELVADAVARRRFELLLIGLFASTALVVASISVYGVMSHALARRTVELGVRRALGASAGNIYRLVFRQELPPFALGLALGIAGAAAIAALLEPLLFQVGAFEPGPVLLVAAVLLGVGVLACWLPARRVVHRTGLAALRVE